MANPIRLGYSCLTENFYVGKMKQEGNHMVAAGNKTDVTLDAKRAFIHWLGNPQPGKQQRHIKVIDGQTFEILCINKTNKDNES